MNNIYTMACRIFAIHWPFTASFLYFLAFSSPAYPQNSSEQYVCYGEPIFLYCNLWGCPMPGATYQWTNSDGTWTSVEQDPVILPGTPGYATDVFYLNLQYSPPEGSSSSGYYQVIILDPILIDHTQSDVQCNGGADGTINLLVSGGGGSFRFNWSNGSVSCNQAGLTAGNYAVTVTDDFNCSATAAINITEPQSPLAISKANLSNADCNGSDEGAIDITVSGGTMPYQYSWSTGETTEDIHSLTVGDYTVTVTDDHNCSLVDSWLVMGSCTPICYGEPIYLYCTLQGCPMPGATYIWTNSGGTWISGEANPVIYPGEPGYASDIFYITLLYSPPEGSFSHGAYIVTLLDPILMESTLVNVQSHGGSDGAIELSVSGGGGPWGYSWSNGSSQCSLSGLTAGSYTVTVTGIDNCTRVASYFITEPPVHQIIIGARVDKVNNACNSGGTIEPKAIAGEMAGSAIMKQELGKDQLIRIYPNPTSGFITIDLSTLEDPGSARMEIYSMESEKVLSQKVIQKKCRVSLSDRPGGIYILKVFLKGQVFTGKIVKR